MKPLWVSKPIVVMVLVLMIVQLACNFGRAAPTSPAPSVVAPQDTQAAAAPAGTQAAATSTGAHATPAEAEAMLNLAVQHYQTVGREQALSDFNVKKAPFADRDLYVVCLGSDHKVTANGGFPLLVGTSADAIKGPNDQPLGQVIWDHATQEPQGSFAYNWTNPLQPGKPSRRCSTTRSLMKTCVG